MAQTGARIAFALGGLAGNNAHGAGFLHGALARGVEPAMISCTSGQIFWVYQYLLARKGDRGGVRERFYHEIAELHRFRNLNLDYGQVALFGRPGVFRPAYYEFPLDLGLNLIRAWGSMLAAPAQSFWARELIGALPGRTLVPQFPPAFFEQISAAFNAEEQIGIAFNSYCPSEGEEYVYLNEAARRRLAPDGEKYGPGYVSSSRRCTSYHAITPEAVRAGLWIYEYGFDEAAMRTVDGAYYRQIMLKELTGADLILVARPINRRWLPAGAQAEGRLPRSYAEIQDLKTEINFNGSYTGERAQIELVNGLVRRREEAARAGADVGLLAGYHQIELVEVEIELQRSFFDYIFESPEVFERAVAAMQRAADAAGLPPLGARAVGE